MSPIKPEDIGLLIFGVGVPPMIMSCYLPSPSTAYDKASGQIASGPESLALLKRDRVIGAVVSLAIAAAASLLAAQSMGPHAAWIFIVAVAMLALFLWEYDSAFKKGSAALEDAG